jgi:hypothetical protein
MEPPIMRPTPGFTQPHLSELPIASEGEATMGPDDWVPYDDPEVPEADYEAFETGRFEPVEPGLPLVEPPQLPRF